MVKVAINGFGRIGRMIFRAGHKDPAIEFVAVNDLTDTKTLAHLLKYDSVHGRFDGTVECTENSLIVNGKEIKVLSEREPEKLPWGSLGIDVALECTGFFANLEGVEKHIKAGAKKVLLSAPAKGGGVKTIVHGVNDAEFDASSDNYISNASCTTNCLSPMAKVLNDKFGIEKGLMTTVHGYTAGQNTVDGPNKDLRRARTAGLNIIPTTTGAAIAVTLVIPELEGKMDGMAMRVPVADGSVTDFVAILKKDTTVEEINAAMKEAANGPMKGILEYEEDPIVSSDIIGNSHSCIFDSLSTKVMNGNMVKVIGWYDNEWGYSSRMIDAVKLLATGL